MTEPRKWLIEKRNKMKLTQQDVADRSELSRTFYTQIETGDRNPSVDNAKKIAKALKFKWTLFFDEPSQRAG